MKLVKDKVDLATLRKMARRSFGNLVKAVIDIKKGIMVVDGELHADQEALLLEKGSKQEDLWGINFYPDLKGNDFIEFDSMINLRPNQKNLSRGVDDPEIRGKICKIVNKLVQK
jgi:hypothetical protein